MPLVPLRKLLDHAAENNYGVAAFNVNNMEQIQAIMEAARETDSPVIVQASRGARSYSQDAYLRHLMLAAAELYPQFPIVMHQDHGNSVATCMSAIDNGFTSVMMDGSLKEDGKTPADFDYNVQVTSEVVRLAHARGVSVEGELGCLGSLETGHGEKEDGHGAEGKLSHDQLLTDPEEAARFVEAHRRRCAGRRHRHQSRGVQIHSQTGRRNPGDGATRGDPRPHPELPPRHARQLVSPPRSARHHQQVRRQAEADLGRAGRRNSTRYSSNGVRKINVDTDNRLAITGAIRKVFFETPEKFDPRDYLKPARDAMKKVCIDRMVAFGQAGQASKVR